MITIMNSATNYCGKSTDTKPTSSVDVNSLYFELDTGDFYYYDGTTWAKIGPVSSANASVSDLRSNPFEEVK